MGVACVDFLGRLADEALAQLLRHASVGQRRIETVPQAVEPQGINASAITGLLLRREFNSRLNHHIAECQ